MQYTNTFSLWHRLSVLLIYSVVEELFLNVPS